MIHPDRASLRQRLIAARESLDAARHHTLSSRVIAQLQALIERLDPKILGFCWPYRAEPDLTGWVADWLRGKPERHAVLPVVIDKDTPLQFRSWHPEARLERDRYGIPFPVEGTLLTPDAVLVPVNGFDARGFRIGYGGGHFDRTLAVMRPAPVTIGVGFELSRLESIDPQPHDVPLDWIVTEAGCVVTPLTSQEREQEQERPS